MADELDVLSYSIDTIQYCDSHKNESMDIAMHVFNRTHPKGRLSFSISAAIERLCDEFGALEAPGMPENDDEDTDKYIDKLWLRLLNLVEYEKQTI